MTEAFLSGLRSSNEPDKFFSDNILDYLASLQQPEEALQIITYALEHPFVRRVRRPARGFFVAFDKLYKCNKQFFRTIGFRKVLPWSHGLQSATISRWSKDLAEQLDLNTNITSCRRDLLTHTKCFRDRKTLKSTNYGKRQSIEAACRRREGYIFCRVAAASIL